MVSLSLFIYEYTLLKRFLDKKTLFVPAYERYNDHQLNNFVITDHKKTFNTLDGDN